VGSSEEATGRRLAVSVDRSGILARRGPRREGLGSREEDDRPEEEAREVGPTLSELGLFVKDEGEVTKDRMRPPKGVMGVLVRVRSLLWETEGLRRPEKIRLTEPMMPLWVSRS